MNELKVFKNDVIDWVIAASPEDATKTLEEHWGSTLEEVTGDTVPPAWKALPDEDVLSILDEDDEQHTAKTCAEWIASNGRGFLASTEY